MKKVAFFLFAVFITAAPWQIALGQDDDCKRTKVGVSLEIANEHAYELLANEFGSRPEAEWAGFAEEMLVEVLSEYEPEITFFSLSKGSGDHHYHFSANMTTRPVGEEYNRVPGFWITSGLISKSNCVPLRTWDVGGHNAYASSLRQTMKNLASLYWPMERDILRFEKDHTSPPRDPELDIQFEKDFISPVDKESRTTEAYGRVYDCRGHEVCDKRGHPNYYQTKIDRLDLKKGLCSGGQVYGIFMVILTNKECKSIGKYTLKNGLDPERKKIRFKTCRLGSGPLIEVEKELVLRGLEVEVSPDRSEIHQDETTDITIKLNETDPDGTLYPVAGKEIQVKITGLENGTVKPKDGYTTNDDGEVILTYKAGNRDEKIRVKAWFQPPDYPDKAEDSASIRVKAFEYDATLLLKKTRTKFLTIQKSETDTKDGCRSLKEMERELRESIQADIYLTLKLKQSAIMPIDGNRWEYYEVANATLSRFELTFYDHLHSNGAHGGMGCAKGGFETTEKTKRVLKERDFAGKEYVRKAVWIIVFDPKTDKALKLIPAGYGVDYTYEEFYSMKSRVWSDDDVDEDSKTDSKSVKKDFGVGPVGDPVDDPTVKSTNEWLQNYLKQMGVEVPGGVPIPKVDNKQAIKKVPPDILVSFGDGKTSFGGRGEKPERKILDGGHEEVRETFSWQATRKQRKK